MLYLCVSLWCHAKGIFRGKKQTCHRAHVCKFKSFFVRETNLTVKKVGLRLKLHCGNSNLLPCEPTCSCYSVTCLLGSTRSSAVFLVIYLNYWVKPLLVQCSCPSDMFELLDQAPPIPVQLSKSQQTA